MWGGVLNGAFGGFPPGMPKNTLCSWPPTPRTYSLCVNNHLRVGRVTIELLHKFFQGKGCVCVCVCVCVCPDWEGRSRKEGLDFFNLLIHYSQIFDD